MRTNGVCAVIWLSLALRSEHVGLKKYLLTSRRLHTPTNAEEEGIATLFCWGKFQNTKPWSVLRHSAEATENEL